MVLTLDGRVRLFSVHGEEFTDGPWKTKERTKKFPKSVGFSFREVPGAEQDDVIVCAKMWSEGIAAFTKKGHLWVATDILKKEQPWVKYNNGGTKYIHCMEVIPHETQPQVLIAPDEEAKGQEEEEEEDTQQKRIGKKMKKTIIVCTEKGSLDLKSKEGPFRCISLSPSGNYIALYNEEGDVSVVSNDFKSYYLKYKTKVRVRNKIKGSDLQIVPKQLLWCGELAVLVYYERPLGDDSKSLLYMVGCFGNCASFDYETPITLCQEIDCARIFSNTSCELLEQVNDHAVDIFRIGSIEPSALLYDAFIDYKLKKPSSIKTVMAIRKKTLSEQEGKSSLELASMECLLAACHEFAPSEKKEGSLQQTLLKAASYGRSFSDYTSNVWKEKNEFSTVCRELRVLNSVRDKTCGIPITYQQYKCLTAKALVSRLAKLNKHYLAINICDHLNIDRTEILIDWGCTKAKLNPKFNEEDEDTKKAKEDWLNETTKEIKEKLKDVSLAQVSLTAYESKNPKLAKKLLGSLTRDESKEKKQEEIKEEEQEDNSNDFNLAPDQVPLFLKMEEIEASLERAISSLDSDYAYLVILYILAKGDKKFLYEKLRGSSYLRRLFICYCRESNRENEKKILLDFYTIVLKFRSIGFFKIKEAYSLLPDETKFNQKLKDAVKDFAKVSKNPIDLQITEEQVKLMDFQKKLNEQIDLQKVTEKEKDEDRQLIENASINETFFFCLLKQKNNKDIRKIGFDIKKEFDISTKTYWFLKVRALTQLGTWDELEKFVFKDKEKEESPIGYIPIVDLCLANGKENEAVKYIPFIKDTATKVEYYIGLKTPMFKEAIQAAADVGDIDLLEYINTRTTNSKTKDTIQGVIDQLQGK